MTIHPNEISGHIARITAAMALLICTLIMAGCSLSTPYPSRSMYTINTQSPAPPAPPPLRKEITLRVRRFVALAPFNDQAFVYRTSANSIRTDYYNIFAAPPADIITSDLIQWLRASQTFAAVIDANATFPHQWVLEGRIQDLSIDVSDPQNAQAVVTIQLFLFDDSGADTRILLDKTYTERAAIAATDPPAAAAGWSVACRKLFGRITDDLKAVSVPQPADADIAPRIPPAAP